MAEEFGLVEEMRIGVGFVAEQVPAPDSWQRTRVPRHGHSLEPSFWWTDMCGCRGRSLSRYVSVKVAEGSWIADLWSIMPVVNGPPPSQQLAIDSRIEFILSP